MQNLAFFGLHGGIGCRRCACLGGRIGLPCHAGNFRLLLAKRLDALAQVAHAQCFTLAHIRLHLRQLLVPAHLTPHRFRSQLRACIALGIGLFQCLAMMPGTSRSAATIIGAMVLGASRPAAAEFSFFLAVPTMLGATVFKTLKTGLDLTASEWALIALGGLTAFITAYIVVAAFMKYIQRHDFKPFGYYRIVLGLLILLLLWQGWM